MPKVQVTLTDSWMYLGTTYLPGVHALDESIATVLIARGATSDIQPLEPVAAEPVQPTNDGNEPPAEPTLESIVGSKAAATLAAVGYPTYGEAMAADDATLSAIDGIGDATIKKLREFKAA